MFYGKNIAQYEASVSNNVVIKNVEKTENPNYLFVDLELGPQVKPGSFELLFTQKGKVLARHNYSLLARQQGSASLISFLLVA